MVYSRWGGVAGDHQRPGFIQRASAPIYTGQPADVSPSAWKIDDSPTARAASRLFRLCEIVTSAVNCVIQNQAGHVDQIGFVFGLMH